MLLDVRNAYKAWITALWADTTRGLHFVMSGYTVHYQACVLLEQTGESVRTVNSMSDIIYASRCGACSNEVLSFACVIAIHNFQIEDTFTSKTCEGSAWTFFELHRAHRSFESFLEKFTTIPVNLSDHHALFLNAYTPLKEKAKLFYKTELHKSMWEKPCVIFVEPHATALPLSSSPEMRAEAGADFARASIIDAKGSVILRAPKKVAKNIFDVKKENTCKDPGPREDNYWEEVLTFVADGLSLQDALNTAEAL